MVQQVSVNERSPPPQHDNVEPMSTATLLLCQATRGFNDTHQGKIEPVAQDGGKTKCEAKDMHSQLRRQASQQLPNLMLQHGAWSAEGTALLERQGAVPHMATDASDADRTLATASVRFRVRQAALSLGRPVVSKEGDRAHVGCCRLLNCQCRCKKASAAVAVIMLDWQGWPSCHWPGCPPSWVRTKSQGVLFLNLNWSA